MSVKIDIDYGVSCGRHWIRIGDKVIAQTSGDDFWMLDNDIRRLAIAIIPNCEWKPMAGDEYFIQAYKKHLTDNGLQLSPPPTGDKTYFTGKEWI